MTDQGSITVTYTIDPACPGITSVELWVRAPGETSFAATGMIDSAPASGNSFSFTVTSKPDGAYGFYTIASDGVTPESPPATPPDTETLVDRTAPSSSAVAPATSGSRTFTIAYDASDPPPGSGLAEVELWVRAPGETSFAVAGPPDSNLSGSFQYTGTRDGEYFFFTVARDQLGNVEPDPQTPGYDTSTVVDTTAPPPPPPSDPGSGGEPAPPTTSRSVGPPRRPAASFVLISGRTMRLARNRSIVVRLNCAGTKDCSGTVQLVTAEPIRVSRGRSRRRVSLTSKSFSIPATRTTSVRIRLSKSKARLVKRLRRVKTMVVIRDRDSAGRARTSTRVITLRSR